MKYTIFLTRECNLDCSYCYIGKDNSAMPLETAKLVIDFAFRNTPPSEKIDIGFFGGEPLIEFGLLKEIMLLIKTHPSYDGAKDRVELSITSNGTIFSEEIADFLMDNDIYLCISCDGPPQAHDAFRRFKGGGGSAKVVERNIARALEYFPYLSVNAVYRPETLPVLPETVDYFADLGLKRIHLNPDFSASWTEPDALKLPEIYGMVSERYMDFYMKNAPRYISVIDGKVGVLLNGGYGPFDKCRMGRGEYAFAPSGNIYPCERLTGSDDGRTHCMGNIASGIPPERKCRGIKTAASNIECGSCGISAYCMNWCGCSNFFSSGSADKAGPFLCASERAWVKTAADVIRNLGEKMGPAFLDQFVRTQTGECETVQLST